MRGRCTFPLSSSPASGPGSCFPPHSLMFTECHPRCLKGSTCHKRQQKLFSSSGSLMGVLQKFRAGSDAAVAEFVRVSIKFPYGSLSNTSQALSGAVAPDTEGRVKHLFTASHFLWESLRSPNWCSLIFISARWHPQMKAAFAEVPLTGPVRALSTENATSAQNMA